MAPSKISAEPQCRTGYGIAPSKSSAEPQYDTSYGNMVPAKPTGRN